MARLNVNQEKLIARVETMRDEVRDAELRHEDCPLLTSQLKELIVFAETMVKHARALLASQRAEYD